MGKILKNQNENTINELIISKDHENTKISKRTKSSIKISEKSEIINKLENKNHNDENKFIVPQEEEFEFILPKILKNKEYLNELEANGIDLEKCLIITNKDGFMNHLKNIKITLDKILFDIEPLESKKKRKRKGYDMGNFKGMELKKDDFLNSTTSLSQEQGMIHFGNKNVELVLSMMIGIRNSINSVGENNNLYQFQSKDQAFKDFNIFNFKQNNFEKEIVKNIIINKINFF